MADVRALLRQQRQSRRIDHPHAAYSDAGKLLCTLCREQIRAESQWESHTKSTNHRQRQAAVVASSAPSATVEPAPSEAAGDGEHKGQTHDLKEEVAVEGAEGEQHDEEDKEPQFSHAIDTRPQTHKRKVSDDDDADALGLDEAVRPKRSRGDISIDVSAANHRRTDKDAEPSSSLTSVPPTRREPNRTPPTLARRMSSTPSRGVELQIPSRPATPAAHRDSSSSSTPGISASALAANGRTTTATTTEKPPAAIATQVDEDEWAAFEAEMAVASAPYADDAVISAPAMNAEESAAAAAGTLAGGDGSGGLRKSRADLDIEGEREDAARAREDELDDMRQLEERVKRLKEKREELRRRASSVGQQQQSNAPARLQSQLPDGDDMAVVEKNGTIEGAEEEEEDEEDDDDEDDDDDDDEVDDDWNGFRFRK